MKKERAYYSELTKITGMLFSSQKYQLSLSCRSHT